MLAEDLDSVEAFSYEREHAAHNLAELLERVGFEAWVLYDSSRTPSQGPVEVFVASGVGPRAREQALSLRAKHGADYSAPELEPRAGWFTRAFAYGISFVLPLWLGAVSVYTLLIEDDLLGWFGIALATLWIAASYRLMRRAV